MELVPDTELNQIIQQSWVLWVLVENCLYCCHPYDNYNSIAREIVENLGICRFLFQAITRKDLQPKLQIFAMIHPTYYLAVAATVVVVLVVVALFAGVVVVVVVFVWRECDGGIDRITGGNACG